MLRSQNTKRWKKKLALHNMVQLTAKPQTMHSMNHTACCSYKQTSFLEDFSISFIVSLSTTILAFILGDFNFPILQALLHHSPISWTKTHTNTHTQIPLRFMSTDFNGVCVCTYFLKDVFLTLAFNTFSLLYLTANKSSFLFPLSWGSGSNQKKTSSILATCLHWQIQWLRLLSFYLWPKSLSKLVYPNCSFVC